MSSSPSSLSSSPSSLSSSPSSPSSLSLSPSSLSLSPSSLSSLSSSSSSLSSSPSSLSGIIYCLFSRVNINCFNARCIGKQFFFPYSAFAIEEEEEEDPGPCRAEITTHRKYINKIIARLLMTNDVSIRVSIHYVAIENIAT